MFSISIKGDASRFDAEQRRILGKQMPFASALALTTLVRGVQAHIADEIVARYDRPTRWTKQSLHYKRAEKKDFPHLSADVHFIEWSPKGVPAGRYLHPSIVGKSRSHKGFEKALISRGIMQASEFAIPGRKMRLNQYGNVSAGTIRKVMSQLKVVDPYQWETNKSRDEKRGKNGRLRGARYFVPNAGSSLPRGIYQRTGRARPKLLFIFVTDTPDYSVILPFKSNADREARRIEARVWRETFDKVVAGPRKRRTGN